MVKFSNCSSKDVSILINNNSIGIIKAGESKSFQVRNEMVTLLLTHTQESYGKLKKAHMLIETTYEVDIADGEEYIIKREKMSIEHDAYYDCLFLYRGSEEICPVEYRVYGIEKLKKDLIHKGVFWKLLETLEDMVGDLIFAPIRTILAIVFIVVFLGWKWLLIIGACVYCFYLIGNCMGTGIAKILGNILGGKFKEESMEERLNRWMDSAYIAEFYSKPNRKPYKGKIER